MRYDLKLRLREIARSLTTAKLGVTGVTGPGEPGGCTSSHPAVTPSAAWEDQSDHKVTPVTPIPVFQNPSGAERHTVRDITGLMTAGVIAADGAAVDWFSHFEERAAILEYDGGLSRIKAERLALADTVAVLGPMPCSLHQRQGSDISISDTAWAPTATRQSGGNLPEGTGELEFTDAA